MKSFKKGFTLIEVLIFLAISGALAAGIIISTASVVDKQRYNGAIRGFMDYMQTVYSEVANPKNENEGGGRDQNNFIYGKLVVFDQDKGNGQVRTYTVVGNKNNIKGSVVRDALSLLQDVNASINRPNSDKESENRIYEMSLQNMSWDIDVQDIEGKPFEGSILIARSPSSGVIYTYVAKKKLDAENGQDLKDFFSLSKEDKEEYKFKTEDISFCIAPKQMILYGGERYEVRLTTNSHDSSGVVLYSLDDREEDGNKCLGNKE